jgi:hypothetical protein
VNTGGFFLLHSAKKTGRSGKKKTGGYKIIFSAANTAETAHKP